ncbi:hypothetical protein CsatB_010777 [Cannabis sativa]
MASVSHSPVAFTGKPASDLLRSSSNGVRGLPLRTLGRTRLGIGIWIRMLKVRKMATETGLDFSDQIIMLENKYHQVG